MVSTNNQFSNTLGKGEIDLAQWLQSFESDAWYADIQAIHKAVETVQEIIAGNESGIVDFTQSLIAANLVRELKLDADAIAATLLADFVCNGLLPLSVIEEKVSQSVALLTDGVCKMRFIDGLNRNISVSHQEEQAEGLRRMLLAMANDIRVVLITLADRVAILRSIKDKPQEEKETIARESMDIYAPLANRLGIWQIKWELEDLSFRYSEPKIYKEIATLLDEKRLDREQYIKDFVAILQDKLTSAGINAEITGRPKHIYSIWRKMERKELSFDQIFDVRAVRIMVPTIADCYAALGVVHSNWNYVRGEFDDYIAVPKENMYQSLHTAVVGAEGKIVEVQIRTPDMHQHAELGVAAHWRYKEGTAQDQTFEHKLAWLRQLLEWKDDISNASEFVEQLKDETFQDQIYVLTPKGKVIDLPKGATPLDFAYQIHTEVGHHCRGAKINGKIVPLTTGLQNSQMVEILTVKQGGPSRDWLNPNLGYLRSAKSRAKVQQWFKQQNFDVNVAEGRTSIEKELQRLGISNINYEKLAQHFNFNKVDQFFASVGRGEVKTAQILGFVQHSTEKEQTELHVSKVQQAVRKTESDIFILGVGDLLTQIARCCKPVPGDPIIGYITKGRGVTIHRRDCQNVLRYNNEAPARLIEVEWGRTKESTYPVDIVIVAFDRHGLLKDITSVLANEKINVIAVNTVSDKKEHKAHMSITLEIKDLSQLSRILSQINQLQNIIEVRRKH